jgi:tetraacyldisaccharide-1-P 4'-kinase
MKKDWFKSVQLVTLLSLTLILILAIIIFATAFLIPAGKEYRSDRIKYKEVALERATIKREHKARFDEYKELQGKNRHVIDAFANTFDEKRFQEFTKNYFSHFNLEKSGDVQQEDLYIVYDAKATTSITSPQKFYEFVEALTKYEVIAAVKFPVHFERKEDSLEATFGLKVYRLDLNSKDVDTQTQ